MWIHDFVRDLIQDHMEDPKARDRIWHRHIRERFAAAEKFKADMNQPTRPWGFWQSDIANARYFFDSDPAVGKLPGRLQPMDGR